MDRPNTRFGGLAAIARFALTLAGIVVAQGILTRYLQVFEYFDLPLIYSVYYGFTRASPGRAIAVGSVLGLLLDSLSGAALGTNGFTKTLIAFIAASAGTRFDVDQAVTRIMALAVFTFLDAALKVALALVTGSDLVGPYRAAAGAWALSAAFNVLLGMILFSYRSRFGNAAA